MLYLSLTKDFGGHWGALGTPEETRAIVLVDRVSECYENKIGLTAMQMTNMRKSYGEISIKNLETGQMQSVEAYNVAEDAAPMNEHAIVITKQVAKTLGLCKGSTVEIVRKLNHHGALLLACEEEEKTNPFGKSWSTRGFVGKAMVLSIEPDFVKGEFEVALTDMQISFLSIEKSLRPLCGEEQLDKIRQKLEPDKQWHYSGILKASIKNIEVNVNIRPTFKGFFPGSGVILSESLAKAFKVELGDHIMLCSRFDCKDIAEAAEMTSIPSIPYTPDFMPKLMDRFLNENAEDYFDDGLQADLLLNSLMKNIELLKDDPEICMKALSIWKSYVHETIQFKAFLQFLRKHRVMEKHVDFFFNKFEELVAIDDYKPNIICKIMLYAGLLDLKNSFGETPLHSIFKNVHWVESKYIKLILKNSSIASEINCNRETALHYACKTIDPLLNVHTLLKKLKKSAQKIPIELQDNEGRTALHHLCLIKNITTFSEKSSVFAEMLTILLKRYPQEVICHATLITDEKGKSPFDYFFSSEEDYKLFCSQLTDNDEESNQIRKILINWIDKTGKNW